MRIDNSGINDGGYGDSYDSSGKSGDINGGNGKEIDKEREEIGSVIKIEEFFCKEIWD